MKKGTDQNDPKTPILQPNSEQSAEDSTKAKLKNKR